MRELDADAKPLRYEGLGDQKRDCVQFVAFNDVENDPVNLTKQLLEEIPTQITEYFDMKGIKANSAKVDFNLTNIHP